jgi:hypothetical protein
MLGRNRRAGRRASRRTTRRVMRRTMLRPGRIFRRRRILVSGFSLLLVGGAAYKIGQAQAEQIQLHTGRPPEDLSPEELENAMEALNIEPQELNDQDKAAIEAEAVDQAPPGLQKEPAKSTGPAEAQDYISEIKRLADLRDMGIITNDEFEVKKKQLLGL